MDITRLDVTATAFFKRQLEHVKTKTYDTKYKNLKAKQFIPVNTDVHPGADFIIWYQYSMAGIAKIVADYADDIPRADVGAVENQAKIYSVVSSYGYSIKEIRRAQKAGVQLQTRKATSARRAMEEKIDNLAWFGAVGDDAVFNIQGLINYPGITEYTVPNGASASPTWASKTPDEIIIDLYGIMNAISVPTKGREEPNQLLIPRTQYNLIAQTRMTDGNSKTILTFFKDNNPGVAVDILDELDGAGAGATDRFMAYVRDPNNLTLEIPLPFEQFAAQQKGLEFVIPMHAETGGVIVYYPESVAFGDGI
jgi:hypothetical protein